MIPVAFVSNSARGELTGRFGWTSALADEGFAVTFVLPRGEDAYADRMARAGVPVVRYRLDRHSVSASTELRTIRDLVGVLLRHRFDIVHSFGHKANIYAGVAAALTRVPVRFQHVTGLGDPFVGERFHFKTSIARMVLLGGYCLLAPTMSAVFFQNSEDQARFGFLPPGKAQLTHGNGVCPRDFAPDTVSPDALLRLRLDLGIPPGALVVTFIGRLKRQKGIADFVSAARAVTSVRPDVVFLIIGDPDDDAERILASAQVGQAGGRIQFLGHRDDTRAILALTDVFVNPSWREGLSRANLEAMAMAKPVVTTDVPGCRETVSNGQNGLLVAPGAVDEMCEAILRLLASDDLRARMGRAGRARVEAEFDVAAVARDIAAAYRRAIERVSRRTAQPDRRVRSCAQGSPDPPGFGSRSSSERARNS